MGFSDLLSWLDGGLLFHGLLVPRAGEPLKLSSWSTPVGASNRVFSSRAMSGFLSPHSPPIRVDYPPTTAFGWRGRWCWPAFLLAVVGGGASARLPLPPLVLSPNSRFCGLLGCCRRAPTGDATIRGHSGKSRVLRQPGGLRLYDQWRDMSSCVAPVGQPTPGDFWER